MSHAVFNDVLQVQRLGYITLHFNCNQQNDFLFSNLIEMHSIMQSVVVVSYPHLQIMVNSSLQSYPLSSDPCFVAKLSSVGFLDHCQ
jgi:hypothetical protein